MAKRKAIKWHYKAKVYVVAEKWDDNTWMPEEESAAHTRQLAKTRWDELYSNYIGKFEEHNKCGVARVVRII